VDAFTAQFGPPAEDNGSSVSYKPQCGAANQTWCAKVDTLYGYDGLRHVAVITLQSQPQWDRAAGLATCEKYLPPDAQLTNEQVTSARGFARIYHAASLQNIFPDNTFNNINGEDIAPGTLHIQYTYPADNDSAHIASCAVSIGAPGG
jgi:hypothetical protein